MKRIFLIFSLLSCISIHASLVPSETYSTAGFYELPETGREVYSMNLAWRFIKSDIEEDPSKKEFDDRTWDIISLPHGLEYLPTEASGSCNYQGIAWYRKRFIPDNNLKGKKLFLNFEGIMGKSEVYINGKLVKSHFGGYTPLIIDITNQLNWNQENVIAVKTDNSDDPLYPVGKPQSLLDFSYFGGIYRDCWLVAHNEVYITNANFEDQIAGGGLFVWFENVSKKKATVHVKAHLKNESSAKQNLSVSFDIKQRNGELLLSKAEKLNLPQNKDKHIETSFEVENPNLWSPDSPNLYYLDITIKKADGSVIDGYRQRFGIRSIEFKQNNGLWINGEPYDGKIMGTNRHQDFAVLGNAVPNSLQWRDAKKLKDAGMKVIRTHYVIDPAFMDACDELGLFALVETPGWQFWSKEPIFEQRVHTDIRNMIRLHRNHASLFFWEPILNETHYPKTFAKAALDICNEEYPYPYSIAACDHGAQGDEYYSLLLRPIENKLQPNKTYFIREWGDNVDDWNAQNSDSRVARNWGEIPMLIQAEHYAKPAYINEYPILCYETICQKSNQIVGACFWHSFDHQRGYHADPFFGGIMDAYRQPKTAYYMFMSQRDNIKNIETCAESGPMIYIAHELTPFSPCDVTVYSNCDEVKLTVFKDGKQYSYQKDMNRVGMPSPIIKFEDAFHFMEWKAKARSGKQNEAYLLAEGFIDGKLVATHKRYPSGQAYQIRLTLDNENIPLSADGSDIVTIVAEIVDKRGTVKRLNNAEILFSIEGEGRIINDNSKSKQAQISWGSAPILVQATEKAGLIKITAQMKDPGSNRPLQGFLEFESTPNNKKELYSRNELAELGIQRINTPNNKQDMQESIEILRRKKEVNDKKLKEVEAQQTFFGIGIND